MANITSKTVTSNFLWRFLERCGAQGVSTVVSIILARLLEPEAYGTIALVTVITTFLQVFVDSGMATSLVQKKNADDVDFSTVFYFNLGVCVLLYGGVFVSAPLIARFYEDAALTPVIRVLSLTLVISGLRNVQQAYISKHMLFRRYFFATLSSTTVSAVVGIWMAYQGYGVWALVGQVLSDKLIGTVVLWVTVRWRPRWVFSFERLKGLFSFGWKLLASGLLETAYKDVRQLIIGKLYTSQDLAFYNKGNQLPHLITGNVNTAIDSVLLPTMSQVQDSREEVKRITRRAMKTSTYVMAPLLIGMAATADVFIPLLLTEKWVFAIPYLRIFCITSLFYPIHTANLNAIKAMGRSDLFLKLEIIKKVIGVIILLATMWFGPFVMALSALLASLSGQIINSWPNKRLLGYSYLEQLWDIAPGLLMGAVMGGCVWVLGVVLPLPAIVTLIIQVACGAVIYIGGSALLRLEAFRYCWGQLRSYIGKKRA